jgi:hypothetical protein
VISKHYDNNSAITSNKALIDWAEVFAADTIMVFGPPAALLHR